MTTERLVRIYNEAVRILRDADQATLEALSGQTDLLLAELPGNSVLEALRGRINGEFKRRV